MTRHTPFALSILLALSTAGCATMTAGVHVDRSVDLTQYRTWDWGPADALPLADPRLADNSFLKDHLEGAVEKRLASLGFRRAAEGQTPDLRFHYHTSITRRFQVNDATVNCIPGDCEPQTIEFEQGTLVIDALDARLNQLVWRGWAQDSVKPALDNDSRMERQINEAVARVFERFPAPADR